MDEPFYVYEVFRRLCKPWWECDFCEFTSEEEADLDNDGVSGTCPDDLWWYVMQRQKVLERFQKAAKKQKEAS